MNAAVFLDRDGVINHADGYVTKPEEVVLIPGAAFAIQKLNKLGLRVVVVTNQPQIAHGLCFPDDIERIHERLNELLRQEGAHIDAFFWCPHHPFGIVPQYTVSCECRKPSPGLLLEAAHKFRISPKESFLVGDRTVDIKAGEAFGCRTILVQTGSAGSDGKCVVTPDFTVRDLLEAAALIESMHNVATLILAGGRGERLRPLTDTIPKPMVPIHGKPLLEHLVALNRDHGIKRIFISGKHLFHKIKEHFQDGSRFGVQIEYIDDGEEFLGSAGALRRCLEALPEHFIVMNGDVATDFDLGKLVTFHFQKGGVGTIVVRKTDHPEDSDLVTMDQAGRALEFFQKRSPDKIGDIANAGLFVFRKNIRAFVPEQGNLEQDVLQRAIYNDAVFCFLNRQFYIKDIGTKERYQAALEEFLNT